MVTLGTSWDVFKHSNAPIELHGTEGSLAQPNPDWFGGTNSLSRRGADWEAFATESDPFGAINWPVAAPNRANYRFLGVADLVRAIRTGRQPRASGALALHVLDVMEAALRSGETKESIAIGQADVQPTPLGLDEARSLLA
jgi:predicted dehydrogenase